MKYVLIILFYLLPLLEKPKGYDLPLFYKTFPKEVVTFSKESQNKPLDLDTIVYIKPIKKVQPRGLKGVNMGPVVDIIKKSEGCSLVAYRCPTQKKKGVGWTIGYGRVLKDGEEEFLKGITQRQADSLLENDIQAHYSIITEEFDTLSLNKKLALTSFIYAVGVGNFKKKSTLYKKLKQGSEISVEDFTSWSANYERNIYFRSLEFKLFNN